MEGVCTILNILRKYRLEMLFTLRVASEGGPSMLSRKEEAACTEHCKSVSASSVVDSAARCTSSQLLGVMGSSLCVLLLYPARFGRPARTGLSTYLVVRTVRRKSTSEVQHYAALQLCRYSTIIIRLYRVVQGGDRVRLERYHRTVSTEHCRGT